MKTFPQPLTAQEEKHYVELLEKGDRAARDILIERNLRLVAHLVKKYSQSERETEDFISIGTVGLIKAVDTFQARKGSRLCTYASRCIENEILMFLRSERKYRREVSLFEPIGTDKEGNEIHLMDIMESESKDIVGELYQEGMLRRLRDSASETLTPRESQILRLRYGLDGEDGERTQREVAAKMGISRSYVSRIEKRALQKLKARLEG